MHRRRADKWHHKKRKIKNRSAVRRPDQREAKNIPADQRGERQGKRGLLRGPPGRARGMENAKAMLCRVVEWGKKNVRDKKPQQKESFSSPEGRSQGKTWEVFHHPPFGGHIRGVRGGWERRIFRGSLHPPKKQNNKKNQGPGLPFPENLRIGGT